MMIPRSPTARRIPPSSVSRTASDSESAPQPLQSGSAREGRTPGAISSPLDTSCTVARAPNDLQSTVYRYEGTPCTHTKFTTLVAQGAPHEPESQLTVTPRTAVEANTSSEEAKKNESHTSSDPLPSMPPSPSEHAAASAAATSSEPAEPSESRPFKSIPSSTATLLLMTECQKLQQLSAEFALKCRNEVIPCFKLRMATEFLKTQKAQQELLESNRTLTDLVAALGKKREVPRGSACADQNKSLLQQIKELKLAIQNISESIKIESKAFAALKEEEKLFRSNSGLSTDGKLEIYKSLCNIHWLQWQENKDGKVLARICFEDDLDENGAPHPTEIALASQPRSSCARIVENVDWAWSRAEEILNQRLLRSSNDLLRRRSSRSQHGFNSNGSSSSRSNSLSGPT